MNVPTYQGPRGFKFLRGDVRYMTRKELFASARQFSMVGVACVLGFVVVGLSGWDPGDGNALMGGVVFMVSIIGLMGFGAAAYLFAQGSGRDESYDPQAVWRADREAWLKSLEFMNPRLAAELRERDRNL